MYDYYIKIIKADCIIIAVCYWYQLIQFKSTSIKLVICTMFCYKLVMISSFNDSTVIKNYDGIWIPDGGKPVCDYEYSSSFHQGIHTILDNHFCSCIDGWCSFIENQDRRVCNSCSGNGEKLALSLWKLTDTGAIRRLEWEEAPFSGSQQCEAGWRVSHRFFLQMRRQW